MALKQDHIITLENKETVVSEGSHMLDSIVKCDLVTLGADETHTGGGIQNHEIFVLEKVTGVTESLIMIYLYIYFVFLSQIDD